MRILLFGYLGFQYSIERSDVTSTKEVIILPPGLKEPSVPPYFFAFLIEKSSGEVRL